ncbi:unnamed protein product [Closterium sp. NIES-65]|nr:unnamed protein product [Closterium sp. NIES-65]
MAFPSRNWRSRLHSLPSFDPYHHCSLVPPYLPPLLPLLSFMFHRPSSPRTTCLPPRTAPTFLPPHHLPSPTHSTDLPPPAPPTFPHTQHRPSSPRTICLPPTPHALVFILIPTLFPPSYPSAPHPLARLILFRASSSSVPHPLPRLILFRASSSSAPHPLPRLIPFRASSPSAPYSALYMSSARLRDEEGQCANAPAADHVTSGASLPSRAKPPIFFPLFPPSTPSICPLAGLALRLP